MIENRRIFFRTTIISVVCLALIYSFTYIVFAEETEPEPEFSFSDVLEVSPLTDESTTDRENSELPISTNEPDVIEPSSEPDVMELMPAIEISGSGTDDMEDERPEREERPDGEHNEQFPVDAQILDSGYTGATVEQDIRALREYTEFFLFGILPIGISIVVIVAGCVWFYRTFLDL